MRPVTFVLKFMMLNLRKIAVVILSRHVARYTGASVLQCAITKVTQYNLLTTSDECGRRDTPQCGLSAELRQ